MLRGYKLIEVYPTADGFDVRLPPANYEQLEEPYDDLSDDIRQLAEIVRGVVRVDLTALEWVTARVAGRLVALWRPLRGSGRMVIVCSAESAYYFRVTHLNRLFEVWALDPERILTRVSRRD